MEEIIFYNSERIPIMQWRNFRFVKCMNDGIIQFELKAQISIFEVSNIYEVNLVELQNFKDSVNSLYNQKLHKVVWTLWNDLLQVELEREMSGSIKQHFLIKESRNDSCLTINARFDQTFLPELTKSVDVVLENIKTLSKI